MKKQKTIAEIEGNLKDVREIRNWAVIIAIIFIILSLAFALSGGRKMRSIQDLKSQLITCQENVEVWTLKLNCTEEDWFGADYFNQIITLKTSDHQNYLNWLGDSEDNGLLDCEVIK